MDARITKTLAGLAAIVGMAAGGAAIGNAASSKSGAMTTTSTPSFPAHGSPSHEGAETAVTGDAATKAQAAAVKYVGSGTAGAVTTDYAGSGYEVTVTKSDGSTVEVHLDSSFNVMQGGGPHGPCGGTNGGAGEQPAATT